MNRFPEPPTPQPASRTVEVGPPGPDLTMRKILAFIINGRPTDEDIKF
jgi:hypothetical protein